MVSTKNLASQKVRAKRKPQPMRDYGYVSAPKRRVWECPQCGIIGEVGSGRVWLDGLGGGQYLCKTCNSPVERKTIEAG